MDDLLGPFKRMGCLRVGADKVVNGFAQAPERGHAQSSQGLTPQDTEPDLDLVQPGGMSRRVMEMHQWMLGQPAVMLGLMGVEVVKDDVKLFVRVLGHHPIHEVQELATPAAKVVSHFHHTRSHFKGRKQGGGAVALVFMAESPQKPARREDEAIPGHVQGLEWPASHPR